MANLSNLNQTSDFNGVTGRGELANNCFQKLQCDPEIKSQSSGWDFWYQNPIGPIPQTGQLQTWLSNAMPDRTEKAIQVVKFVLEKRQISVSVEEFVEMVRAVSQMI